ncbi:MAG: carboxymuconolactone decarboxylase family protein [Myxococcales bacterium]|nr:MAG: carboxymuconolactone decarboxylase family protein [Myxococcales bacterium]
MKARLDPAKVAPELMSAMLELEGKVRNSGLPLRLIHLVKIRASQMNGCAYCVHMHVKEAHESGETHERLHLLSTWQESPLFSPRERAALAWTESLTLIAETRAPDDVYEELSRELTEAERVKLTMVIVAINGWNRIAVGFRKVHPVKSDDAAA